MAKTLQVQIELTSNEMAEIMKLAGITNLTDALNNALALFEWAVREKLQGRAIASVDPAAGGYYEVVLPAFTSLSHECSTNQNHFPERCASPPGQSKNQPKDLGQKLSGDSGS